MPSPRINSEYENLTHFITLTVIEWIDIFTKSEYYEAIVKSLAYCRENKGLLLYEYVIMTNHLHIIARAKEGHKLSQIISDIKKHTTREIFKLLQTDNRHYILNLLKHSFDKKEGYETQVWQRENYPEVILSGKFLQEKITYLYNNPVKRGFVAKPEEWQYSSARNRILGDNLIIKSDELEE